jgi:hypothetical protein
LRGKSRLRGSSEHIVYRLSTSRTPYSCLLQYPPRIHCLVLLISKDSNTNKISQKVRIQNLIGCHTSGKVRKALGRALYLRPPFEPCAYRYSCNERTSPANSYFEPHPHDDQTKTLPFLLSPQFFVFMQRRFVDWNFPSRHECCTWERRAGC